MNQNRFYYKFSFFIKVLLNNNMRLKFDKVLTLK